MGCCLCSSCDTEAKLVCFQHRTLGTLMLIYGAFSCEATEDAPHGYRSEAMDFFLKGEKPCSKEERLGCLTDGT